MRVPFARRFVLLVLAALTLCLLPSAAQASTCRAGNLQPGQASAKTLRAAVLCEVNKTRRAHGLGKLRSNRKLQRAATAHSRDMAARNYFSHVSPEGRGPGDRIRAAGWRRGWGEVLAWGCQSKSTARQAVVSWLHSPPHRAVILSGRFRFAGAGIAVGAPMGGCSPVADWSMDVG
jgi:uncharacterized protein YkwD